MTLISFSLLFIFAIVLLIAEYYIKFNNKVLTLVLIAGFSLFTAVRTLDTADTTAYALYYQSIGTSFDVLRNSSSFEPGYVFINVLFNILIGQNYRLFFFVLTFFCMIIVVKSLEVLGIEKKVLPLIVYISFFGIYFHSVILRAGIAFVLILYSLVNLNKNNKKSLILFLLSLLFHRSSIFTLPIYIYFFMKSNNIKKRGNFKLIRVFILFLVLIIYIIRPVELLFEAIRFADSLDLFQNTYAYYIDNIKLTSGYSLRFIFNWAVGFFFLHFGIFEKKEYHFFFDIYVFGLLILSVFSAFLWIERITDFYLGISFLLFSYILKNNNQKVINILLVSIYIIINMIFVYRIVI